MERALVELTVRYGPYGDQSQTVAVQIPEDLARELLGKVEMSDEPFSLMLASPGLYGGKGDAVTIRRKTFKITTPKTGAVRSTQPFELRARPRPLPFIQCVPYASRPTNNNAKLSLAIGK